MLVFAIGISESVLAKQWNSWP